MLNTTNNRLLNSLSPACRAHLLTRCVEVDLPLRKSLYEASTTPAYAYFMTSGVASVVTTMPDGGSAEVGLIGSEGLVGALHLFGPAQIATDCFIQLTATALRIPFGFLEEAFRTHEEIRDRILEFGQEQTIILAQLAGCHRLHEAEQRLSRWLLMAQDLTQSNVLEFTQEFLAMMLGSRRTTVTVIAGNMQRDGLIEYSRGKVKVINREGLEAAACDCYQIARNLNSNLYTHPLRSPAHAHASNGTQSTA